ncbi:MAG: hypothetical protein ABI566_08060 [Pseudolysinimonas sp.]
MARLTLRHRLARVHPFVWIGAVAAIAGLVAWPLGGWDTVELQSTKTPVAEPGDLVAGSQFSIRVESAELTTVHPDGFSELEPGWTWLRIELEVTNETDLTEFSSALGGDYDGSITIDEGALGFGSTAEDSESNTLRGDPYLVSDGTYLPDLQPGLPTRVEVIFDVRDDAWTIGDELTIGIIDRFPYESVLGSGIRYGFPALIADVPITLEQGAQATPDPDDEVVP